MFKKNNGNDIRQVNVNNLNISVNLLSSFEHENMDFLIEKAIMLMDKLKKEDEK